MSSDEVDSKAVFQFVNCSDDDLKFQCPSAVCISGPSQCGKSTLIVKLIKQRQQMFSHNFTKCFYCQPVNLCLKNNPIFEQILKFFPTAELICGLPDVTKLALDSDESHKLLIINDLMSQVLESAEIVNLLSVQIHHSNITALITLHNVYFTSKFSKTIRRNFNYNIFFYNRLDLQELKCLSIQLGKSPNFLQECFNFLTSKFPHENAYLLIDGHYKSKIKSLYVRSHIFPDNNGKFQPIIFFPE